MRKLAALFLGFVVFGFGTAVFAVNPDEVLENSALEQRARALSVQIRCLVCQNQSIDDSDAELARELRVLVREKLVGGMSDQEVLDFLVERYGEFVLLKPPVNLRTYVLWGTPFVLLFAGTGCLALYARKRTGKLAETNQLSEEEEQLLSQMLDRDV